VERIETSWGNGFDTVTIALKNGEVEVYNYPSDKTYNCIRKEVE